MVCVHYIYQRQLDARINGHKANATALSSVCRYYTFSLMAIVKMSTVTSIVNVASGKVVRHSGGKQISAH